MYLSPQIQQLVTPDRLIPDIKLTEPPIDLRNAETVQSSKLTDKLEERLSDYEDEEEEVQTEKEPVLNHKRKKRKPKKVVRKSDFAFGSFHRRDRCAYCLGQAFYTITAKRHVKTKLNDFSPEMKQRVGDMRGIYHDPNQSPNVPSHQAFRERIDERISEIESNSKSRDDASRTRISSSKLKSKHHKSVNSV